MTQTQRAQINEAINVVVTEKCDAPVKRVYVGSFIGGEEDELIFTDEGYFYDKMRREPETPGELAESIFLEICDKYSLPKNKILYRNINLYSSLDQHPLVELTDHGVWTYREMTREEAQHTMAVLEKKLDDLQVKS